MELLPASNQHFFKRYPHTRCSHASGLLASITSDVYQSEQKWSLLEVVRRFSRVLKITIGGPSSIHRLAWNTTVNYGDFLP